METVRIHVETHAEDGYLVRLLAGLEGAPTNGEPAAIIPADLDAERAPEVLQGEAIDVAVRNYLRDTSTSPAFSAIGTYLGGLLLRGDVADSWERLAQAHPEGIRTLLDIQDENLKAVPWELMQRERRLFLNEKTVFARIQDFRPDTAQELVPLRLLVVVGAQDETDELGTADEVRGIKRALPAFRGRIDAVFLHQPSQADLLAHFDRIRPHVLHFMGHGVLERDEPALRVADWSMTRQFIVDFLQPMPRLAVLNACRSGDAARAGNLSPEAVGKLTDAFLANGAAATIGMQGDVRGRAAGWFGGRLYEALGEGLLLDRAVVAARRQMAVGSGNEEARDWSLPSLTLGVAPEQVLPLVCNIEDPDREDVEKRLFTPIGLFVGRAETRWDLLAVADPHEGEPQRLVRIVGDGEAGKTWLVNWIRTRCAFRGQRVRYVDFGGPDNHDFVRALEIIRTADEDVPSLARNVANAFERFTFDLAYLANGKIPPEEPVGEAPPEIPNPLQLGDDNVRKIFTSFRDALEAATAESPLLLILDHVGRIVTTDFQTRIFRYLIEPIVAGQPPNARLIVVLSRDEQRSHWPSDGSAIGQAVPVDLFTPEDFKACAEEVVLAMGKDFTEDHEILIDKMAAMYETWPVSPKALERVQLVVSPQ